MQIVNKSFFSNQNYIHIPLAVNDPSSSASNATELDYLCEKLEREILINALGLNLYNEIKALSISESKFSSFVTFDRYSKYVKNSDFNCRLSVILEANSNLSVITERNKIISFFDKSIAVAIIKPKVAKVRVRFKLVLMRPLVAIANVFIITLSML